MQPEGPVPPLLGRWPGFAGRWWTFSIRPARRRTLLFVRRRSAVRALCAVLGSELRATLRMGVAPRRIVHFGNLPLCLLCRRQLPLLAAVRARRWSAFVLAGWRSITWRWSRLALTGRRTVIRRRSLLIRRRWTVVGLRWRAIVRWRPAVARRWAVIRRWRPLFFWRRRRAAWRVRTVPGSIGPVGVIRARGHACREPDQGKRCRESIHTKSPS